jgi:uncharacterized protein DUF4349
MAVIDDDLLRTLMGQAGDSFDVPESGMDDILRRATGTDTEAVDAEVPGDEDAVRPVLPVPLARRAWIAASEHRLLSVAAAVVAVVVIATSSALLTGSKSQLPQNATSALATRHGAEKQTIAGEALPPSVPTTTTPGFGVGASAAAPSLEPSANQGVLSGGAGTASTGSAATSTPSSTNAPLPAGEPTQPTRIEQTGSLTLQVSRHGLATTMTKLTYLATAYGGFVANSQTQSAQAGGSSGSVTLQVPVANFATVLKTAQSLGATSQLTTKADDVTSQYVNLQEQIAALEASRQQYLLIMTKATTIGDILSVQSQLDSLENQIDQLQGQEQLLNSETTYSTLTVTVNEKGAPQHHVTKHHESGIDSAWHSSLHGFASGVDGLVRIAGPVLFTLLCAAVLLILGRLSWRRYQRHRL